MATKEEMIVHWMDIVNAVFHAEDKLRDEWNPKLKEALNMSPDERVELCDSYIRAIATEIIDNSGMRFEEENKAELLENGVKVIEDLFGVDVRNNKSRVREVADLRAIYCYRMRNAGVSLSDIGRFLGIDHSTVHHGCKKVSDALDYPLIYSDLVERYTLFNSVEL